MMAAPDTPRPDLDSRANIESFVDMFYLRLLADPLLAPIFTDVANIDLSVHLPHIKDYWCKLLLGDSSYQRHTMQIHRRLHDQRALQSDDFQRWLASFEATVDENFAGERARRAKHIAATIARNMQQGLARGAG